MIKPIVIGFFAAVIFVIVATYLHLKAYKEPNIYYDSISNLQLIYIEVRGDYAQTSAKLTEVEDALAKQQIICESTFGLFFDDPEQVATQDLKSWVGCAFHKTIDIPTNYAMHYIKEEGNILSADFEGSPALGPAKVYPKAKKMLGSQLSLFPALEIYSYSKPKELKTKYYFALSQVTVGKSAKR
jgi:AraC family transcriptional regulator